MTERPASLTGDMRAIINKHNELHALLEYICIDEFEPFGRLSGSSQQFILLLARSASSEIAELFPPN